MKIYKKIDPDIVFSGKILEWSEFEAKAYLVFASYANLNTAELYPSQETLAKKIGCSPRMVRYIAAKFESLEIIKIKRTGRSNIYTFPIANQEPDRQSTLPIRSAVNDCLSDRKSTLPTNNKVLNKYNKTTTDGPPTKSYMELLNEEDVVEEPVVVVKKSVREENQSIADWLKAIKAYWIDVTSVESFIRQYNKEYVYNNIDVLAKRNDVDNKKGYLIKTLRDNILLSHPKTEAYTKEKHNKYVDDQIEKRRQEHELSAAEYERDYDPEKPKNHFGNFRATHPEEPNAT